MVFFPSTAFILIFLCFHDFAASSNEISENTNIHVLQDSMIDNQDLQDQRDLQAKIIGGSNVPLGEYPWFARATLYNHAAWGGCGGMLVAPEFVLTAAHCIGNNFIKWGGYQIGALCTPEVSSNNCGQKDEKIKVEKVFKHPYYKSATSDRDFALVKLESASTIKPVAMDHGTLSPKYPEGKSLWTIGFGDIDETGFQEFPNKLQHTEVFYTKNYSCNQKYGGKRIKFSMMCAAASGRDSCQGDSGGPLYDKVNDVLVGIVSWGYGCAKEGYPGVYSRIAKQWHWIETTICNNHTPSTAPNFCKRVPTAPPTASPTALPTSELGSASTPTPPSPTPPSPTPPTNSSKDTLEIIVQTDLYGSYDNKWTLQKRNKSGVYEVVEENTDLKSNFMNTDKFSYDSSSCFKFIIYDEFGDGLKSKYGDGYYSIIWKGQFVVLSSDMAGKSSETTYFGDCGK